MTWTHWTHCLKVTFILVITGAESQTKNRWEWKRTTQNVETQQLYIYITWSAFWKTSCSGIYVTWPILIEWKHMYLYCLSPWSLNKAAEWIRATNQCSVGTSLESCFWSPLVLSEICLPSCSKYPVRRFLGTPNPLQNHLQNGLEHKGICHINSTPREQWKKPWLVRLYRGLYYPVI